MLLCSLIDDYERLVRFDVIVKEELTERSQNVSTDIVFHKDKYKLELIKTSEYFKPGLKYSVYVSITALRFLNSEFYIKIYCSYFITDVLCVLQVKLSYHDGTPVQDNRNPVKIRHGFAAEESDLEEKKYMLPRNGLILLVFYPPINTTSMSIEVCQIKKKKKNSSINSIITLVL